MCDQEINITLKDENNVSKKFIATLNINDLQRIISSADEQIYKNLISINLVVKIIFKTRPDENGNRNEITGTGWFYCDDNYIITVDHIGQVSSLEPVVYFKDGKYCEANIVYKDDNFDICILKLKEDIEHGKLFCSPPLTPGSICYSVGFIEDIYLNKGNLQILNNQIALVDARCDNGYSGGPIIEASTKRVIGIIKGGIGKTILATQIIPSITINTLIMQYNYNNVKNKIPELFV